jgi:hypothetical protein
LLLGSWESIQQLGRVPRRLIWDNEPGIGRRVGTPRRPCRCASAGSGPTGCGRSGPGSVDDSPSGTTW